MAAQPERRGRADTAHATRCTHATQKGQSRAGRGVTVAVTDTKPRTTRMTIMDAIRDLHNQEQIVTREVLRETTGLKMTLVDDHIAGLLADEKIRRVKAGVFMPMDAPPPARPISVTDMPDGIVILEIRDQVMHLTPREARTIANRFSGQAAQLASIQLGHELGALLASLQRLDA
jgi:hypothetical protein